MDSLSVGSLLQSGKYKILKVLGQGGFGITYLAEQVALGRKVAIKEFFMKDYCDRNDGTSHVSVPTENSRDLVNSYKQKFVKEAQMIASLRNSHIVRIHDIFEENGTAYYVMEYLNNGSLIDVIKQRGPLPEAEAIQYIIQVGDALSYIHERNILHLDVKPSNILLNDDGNVVLIDFGISKRYDESGGQTSTTPVGVSKGYAPIEQYQQGSVTMFSPAADVYSLGATLFFLLTGTTPPEAAEVYEDGLPDPGPTVSDTTKSAINKVMASKRKERPQSVRSFMDLLCVQDSMQNELKSTNDPYSVVNTESASQDEETILSNSNKETWVETDFKAKENGIIESGKNHGEKERNVKSGKGGHYFYLVFLGVILIIGVIFLYKLNHPTENVISIEGTTEYTITFPNQSSSSELAFNKNFTDEWTYITSQEWCRIAQTNSPERIIVLCDENTSTETRQATIHFCKRGESDSLAQLSITQFGVDVIKFKDSKIKLRVGDKHTILYTIYSANTHSVKWSSSNTDIATVSADGIITARRIGKTIITAKTESTSSSCSVEVIEKTPPFGSIKVSSEPTGATIWIDGTDLRRTTPVTLQDIPAGNHVIRLIIDGYEDYSGTVNVVSGQQSNVAQKLSRKVSTSSSIQSGNSTLSSNKATTGTINGHEWVDLGLSVKWATCNIGAYSPSDYGRYFSWSSSDMARSNWGGTWRTPTEAEFRELRTNCNWTWTTQGGKYGMKVTSKKNGKSIFLPAAGMLEVKDTPGVSSYYWSSSQCAGNSDYSWALYFDRRPDIRIDDYKRSSYSFTIRPVTD